MPLVQYGMVWYCMEQYDMVWNGVAWNSKVGYVRVGYGRVGYGRVGYGMVGYGMVWCGPGSMQGQHVLHEVHRAAPVVVEDPEEILRHEAGGVAHHRLPGGGAL